MQAFRFLDLRCKIKFLENRKRSRKAQILKILFEQLKLVFYNATHYLNSYNSINVDFKCF